MDIGFITYPVSDIERARKFYREVCGFKDGDSLSKSWHEFDLDGIAFAIVTGGEEMGTPPGSAFSLALEVGDLAPFKEKFERAGLKVQSWESPRCDALFVPDPDGNRIAFHHLKDASIKNG